MRAASAFGGIAVASAVALDLIVTSGWQIDPPPTELELNEPSPTYIAMMDGGWRSDYSYSTVSWDEQLPIDDQTYETEPVERLAGAPGGDDPYYRTAHYDVPSEDELYREIAALYAEQDARAAEAERRAEERMEEAEEAELRINEDLKAVESVVDEEYRRVSTRGSAADDSAEDTEFAPADEAVDEVSELEGEASVSEDE
ncbi:hypothetical protein [Vitreimonas sp.]|uniref:hypothetical protein n=1 Tax=Vitreimonas sp. TaxID=3069702 RepID=UPI002D7876AB|nr:hypothetical protein [Vitreimonas sp.]